MIDFVYLDVGGTLLDPYPSVGAVYARAGRAHGLEASPEALSAAFSELWRGTTAKEGKRLMTFGRDEEATRDFWRDLVGQVLERVGFEGDRSACFDSMWAAFDQPESWRVYDDVAPLLEGLEARGLPVGILSNWDYRLPALLETVGLGGRFDPVVVSCFEGVAKPSVELYQRAAERCGVAPERILYVGDHRHLDLDPALQAGFQAYVIDRSGRDTGERVVRSLTELLARLPPP